MRISSLITVVSLIAIAGCAPIVDSHGFVTSDAKPVSVETGTDNKTTILTRYGNPSQVGVFNEQVWYYIGYVQTQQLFFKPRTQSREITAISFDEDDKVAEVRRYALTDGKVFAYDERTTPTRGREVTFLEQLFGSVGRSTVNLPGTEPNLPTAAGGARRQ